MEVFPVLNLTLIQQCLRDRAGRFGVPQVLSQNVHSAPKCNAPVPSALPGIVNDFEITNTSEYIWGNYLFRKPWRLISSWLWN